MTSWGQLWAIGSISRLVHDLFTEAVYYRIPNNDRLVVDSRCTLAGGCSSQQYRRLFKSRSRHSWLPGLPPFHITLHTQCPPSHWTMDVFQSFDLSALSIAWDFPIIGKSVSSSVTRSQSGSWGMASSLNPVPSLAFYDLWQPCLTFSPCLYVWWALQPYDLGFSGLACFCYLGHRNWYHGSQEIF